MDMLVEEFEHLKDYVACLQKKLESKEKDLNEKCSQMQELAIRRQEIEKQEREVLPEFFISSPHCLDNISIFRFQKLKTLIHNYLEGGESLSVQMNNEHDILIRNTKISSDMVTECEAIDDFTSRHTACGSMLRKCTSDLQEPLSINDDVIVTATFSTNIISPIVSFFLFPRM